MYCGFLTYKVECSVVMAKKNVLVLKWPYRFSCIFILHDQGRIQDFKLGGAHLKKLHRAEEGAKNVGVFRMKNHDFTQKNHIISNCGGRRENFWGISCEKSRFYAKKSYFFQF